MQYVDELMPLTTRPDLLLQEHGQRAIGHDGRVQLQLRFDYGGLGAQRLEVVRQKTQGLLDFSVDLAQMIVCL